MLTPEEFNSERYRIYWPAILVVFAVQMAALIAVSFAVINHSSPPTGSSNGFKAERNPAGPTTPLKTRYLSLTTPN